MGWHGPFTLGGKGTPGQSVPGDQGEQGDPGDPTPGPAGAPGAASTVPGPPGTSIPGDQGEEGEPGMHVPGSPGAQGLASTVPGPAVPGFDGDPGEDGYPIPGNQGIPGLPSLVPGPAIPGFEGDQGEDGAHVPGIQGPASTVPGPPGQGIPGDQGDQGEDGMPIPGIQGIPGLPSLVPGPAVPGFEGDQGEDGAHVPGIQGLASTVPGPPGQGIPGEQGDQGEQGDFVPGIAGPASTVAGPPGQGIPGDQGDQGEQGDSIPGGIGPASIIPGPPGQPIPGEQGDQGDQGDPIPGPQGTTGNTGGATLIGSNITIPGGNTVTSTSETACTSTVTIPANPSSGDVYLIRLAGVYSGTTLPTLEMKVKLGSVIALDTGALSGFVPGTNLPWSAEGRIIVQSPGAAGQLKPNWADFVSTANTAGLSVLKSTAVITVDTTSQQAVSVTFQWGAGGTGQTITLEQIIVERISTAVVPTTINITQEPKFVDGYQLSYGSNTVLVGTVGGTSTCADSTGLTTITLTGQVTVNPSTDGAIQGNDGFQGPGTASCAGATTAVVGTNTTFTTSFGTRAGDGTISTVGTAATGTGTGFMNGPHKLFLGDLIGTAAKGYSQVTAIADDTHCTLQAAIPGGDLTTSAWNVIENPTLELQIGSVIQVAKITDNTHLNLAVNGPNTAGNVTYRIGVGIITGSTMPASNQIFNYIWVGSGVSGTGCFTSTQRTTPFGITGYNTSVRKIGSYMNDGAVVPFSQTGDGRQKTYTYENAKIGDNTRVLSSGGANLTWTPVICSAAVPPTANAATFMFTVTTTIGRLTFLRRRNTGSATVSRNTFVICTVAGGSNTEVPDFPIDGAQAIDYSNDGASGAAFVDVVGYREDLG